ncbi:hypothetical protein [Candidatus Paracaedibacter symbiosus]|nr:hypothetical protein [Candidatus Paracaedibacter symbiosus]
MQQFDYVLLAYLAGFFIFGTGATFIIHRDRQLRQLLSKLSHS